MAAAAGSVARRVFSGIQPTGIPHLGNYLGAIVNWVKLQDDPQMVTGPSTAIQAPASDAVVYCVVDLHAMTMPYNPAALNDACRLTAASLIACGIDPQRSILFRQSAVRAHTELAWLLSCITPLGALQRMTQYKDKAKKGKSGESGLGLLSYPVLQAADILLYRATHVPVGEDQHQHLELAREVAMAFNRRFGSGSDVLPPPATVSLGGAVARVMSLRDGTRKMSKSDADDGTRINLTDSADAIADKIRKARTDSTTGFTWDPEGRPDKSNLLGIFAALSGESVEALAARYGEASAADFKRDLTELVVGRVVPIGRRISELMADSGSAGEVDAALDAGARRAQAIASDTMDAVRALTGYR